MKAKLSILLAIATIVSLLAGCGGTKKPELSEICEYFFETGTYTELDYGFVNGFFAENNDNWGGGCSAISAVVDGERLVGRNMDLNISKKCAYFVKTQVPGKYGTIGLAYTFRDFSPDYETVKSDGISEDFSKILPFMCDDVINSEGLHIEINMRNGEVNDDGSDKYGVEHTNPDAPERIYVFNLVQYFALNCKNLEEAREYLANDIDVYSQKYYWNYCFILTDAEGNSALLEFGRNNYYWTEPDENGIVAQTNFYVNEELRAIEKVPTGLGRYDAMMEGIGEVETKHDLYELMKKIQFSSYYLPYSECKHEHFDPRSEGIGAVPELTYEELMNPDYESYYAGVNDAVNYPYWNITREEKQELNALWESSFTEVVNPKEKTIEVRLFENEDCMYRLSFSGAEKIGEIK